ncbi:hypothetical protein CCHL11_07144 [Colletotrichum chlorophyti]|uniref:Uncharacterized protein n=1 Tax=Colletotrichum chlorophyti TaxID=708187 RepID=A0A1Q8S0K5_9PEZI|nr:hypothetical protein CCHL11_07144 [Colletotrichum chlorophyti]
METASRLALMAIVANQQRKGGGGEKATWRWNGSTESLPIIRVENYDAEAGWHGKGPLAGRGDGRRRGGGGLEGVLWWMLLGMECLAVAGVEGWIVCMGVEGRDFEGWNWLTEFATPALVVLFSVSFSAALLRGVGCLGKVGELGFQAAGVVLATFCAVVVCAGVGGVRNSRGVGVAVGLVVKMWFLYFVGLWCAVLQWYRADREEATMVKGKRTTQWQRPRQRQRERGYGTTSGGLAMVDEGLEGFVGDL